MRARVVMAVLVLAVGFALPGPEVGAQVASPGLLPVPSPLPAGAPGDVIASEPFAVDAHPFAVEGHQVLYLSTDRFDGVHAVSGAVLVPTGVPAPPGGRPVVAVPHGTVGISDGCTPSIGVQWSGQVIYDDVDALLAGGAIVVATDYHGLGTPGVHPYMDGVDAGRAVLDSIRAAATFGGTGPAAVSGMSQGGHATLFAGSEHAAGYAPEIDLRGIAPVAAPTLTSLLYAVRDTFPDAASHLAIGLTGLVASRPDLDRTDLLTPAGMDAYDAFLLVEPDLDTCLRSAFEHDDIDAFVSGDALSSDEWNDALVGNEPGRDRIDVPILMVASDDDETIPRFVSDVLCADLTDLGADLRVWMYEGEDHVGVSYASAPDRATWLLGVLAGGAPAREVDWIGPAPAEVLDGCAPGPPEPGEPGPGPDGDDDPPPPAAPATPVRTTARFAG